VADSEEGKMEENIESLDDLKENLKYYNKDLQTIPFVMQYNKRDLERVISIDELEHQLNPDGNPSFEASAISGKGVMETLTMCCKMVLKQIQEKSNTLQEPSSREKQRQEGTKEVPNELPSLTLVDTHNEEELADSSLPQESTMEATTSEVADGNDLLNESTVSIQEREGPDTQQQFSNETAEVPSEEGLLSSEPEIQLEPSSSQPEVGESPFLNQEQPQASMSFKEEGLPNDTSSTVSNSGLDSSGLSEDPAPQEEKNTCPRCSLKFKPNVKQCPICRVQLLSAGEQGKEEPSTMAEAPSGGESFIPEKPDSSLPAEGTNAENGLEIISCGQPSKTSHTAIKVPLTLKVNGTGKEITVDVAIDFGNGLLK
jgi:hypothetical protein